MGDDAGSSGSSSLVDAYMNFRSILMRPRLKRHDTLRLVRLNRVEFEFRHVVHGYMDGFHSGTLSALIDQGHIHLPLPDDTVFIETLSDGSDWVSDFSDCWIKIGIRRQSLELVTTKLNRASRVKVFFNIQYGGPDSEDEVFGKVFSKWKSSKQVLLEEESAKAEAGLLPPSNVIKLQLFEHQKQGLRWMVGREEYSDDELPPFWEECNGVYRTLHSSFFTTKKPQTIRGGILADDLGMGKTCTLLSLISYTKVDRNVLHFNDVKFEWRPTLVVCPPLALAIWKRQIEQCSCPGSLKICTYSEKSSLKDPNMLRQHDIVLTTYNIVRKQQSDSLLYQIDWWRVIFDDAHVLEASPTTPFVNLKAKRRWAVSGKLIHMNFHSLILVSLMECLQLEQNCYSVHPLWQAEILVIADQSCY